MVITNRRAACGQSSTTHGFSSGGQPSNTDIIDKFAFGSSANATDHGNLSVGRGYPSGQQV